MGLMWVGGVETPAFSLLLDETDDDDDDDDG